MTGGHHEPDPKFKRPAALSYAMGKAIDAGVGLEQLLVAVETLWDRGIQSEAILPLKIRNALAYRISRAKDSAGTELLMPFVKNQERKQNNLFSSTRAVSF